MVPLLSEWWRFAQYLLRPEDGREEGLDRAGPTAAPLAGSIKTLFWAGAALLAGLALAQLGG